MNYTPKILTITNEDVIAWTKMFEGRTITIPENKNVLVPGFCVWSYAHEDMGDHVAASIEIRFSKPIYTNETICISQESCTHKRRCVERILVIKVNEEIRQRAKLKCLTFC